MHVFVFTSVPHFTIARCRRTARCEERAVTSSRWTEWSVILSDVERHGGLSLLLYISPNLSALIPVFQLFSFFNHDSTVATPGHLPAACGRSELGGFSERSGERGGEEDSGLEHSSGQDHRGDRAVQPGTLCRPELHVGGRGGPDPAPGIYRSFGELNISDWNPAITPACNRSASFSLLATS